MSGNRFWILAGVAAVLLGSGIALRMHTTQQQSVPGGSKLFADLSPALGEVSEIRLSKGDGSRTTLRKGADGWTVVERQFPADSGRVRELVLGMVDMKVIEAKTSDPANYGKLGVEKPDTPTAASTLVEVVAGQKTWSLIVGRNGEGRTLFVRKPDDATSALVEPAIAVDPDPKRWIDHQLTDLRGSEMHELSVTPAKGPSYLLTRAKRGDTDLALSPVPKGRAAANAMVINGQADGLTAFHFDDQRAVPATPPASVDRATFRTFDGQVFELSGHKDGDKAYVSVAASRDAALAAQFAQPGEEKPAAATPAAPAAPMGTEAAPAPAPAAAEPKKPDQTAERVAARAKGVEFEIPLYKYDAIFKPLEDLLEKKPEKTAAK